MIDVDGRWAQVQSDALLWAVFERTPVGMSLVTPDRRPLVINPALALMLGYSAQELSGLSISDFTHPEDLTNHVHAHDELLVGKRHWYRVDKRYRHKDGHTVWARLHVAGVYDESGQLKMLVSQVYDMSAEVQQRERAGWLAEHDQLTGVLNRQRFAERVDRDLRRGRGQVLYVIDVDEFHEFNAADGHRAGDELLLTLAAGLVSALPESTVIGRLQGDRFGCLLSAVGTPQDVAVGADALRVRLADDLRGFCFTTVSIGVAGSTPEVCTSSLLLVRAETALRQAKRGGGNRTETG